MRSIRLALLLALLATPAWASVQFAANGNTTVTAGTGTCTPSTTTLGVVGPKDIVLLVATGEHDRNALALTTANGFVAVANSIFGGDGDATEENPEIGMRVWWVRGSSWTAAPVVTDTGDHTSCALHRFTGAIATGDPWDVTASGNDSNANDTSASIPGATTTVANTYVVLIQGTSNNATATTNCGAYTNANLASITERFDSTNTSGLGGGHCIITGTKASIGTYAASTATLSATTFKAAMSIALKPECVGSGICREQYEGALTDSGTSVVVAYPGQVQAGNLLVIGTGGFKPSSDPFVLGDISQSAGTATLGSFQLDVDHNYNVSSGVFQDAAIYSAPVTGTGTCTITVGGAPASSAFIVRVTEFSGLDVTAGRVDGTNSGEGATGAPTTGTVASTAGALFLGAVTTNTSGATTHTPGADYEQISEEENGAVHPTGNTEQRIVTSSTTDAADWTAPTTVPWSAVVAAYKVAGGEPPPACELSVALMGVGCR